MQIKFGRISDIDPEVEQTWANTVFLTFDIDWAHDEVLVDTLNLVEQADVCATWFVTHDTPVLANLKNNPQFELGIHPNFNFLLDGDGRNGRNAKEVIDRLMTVLPDAKSVRSHSMTQNSVLFNLFKDAGLTHDANHFIPYQTGIELKPWLLWNGLCRVPYGWEDDVHAFYETLNQAQKSPAEIACGVDGLKVFDFHPIHVFLNTESLDRYERTRPLHHNPKELIKHRYEGYGTRNRLLDLLECARKS